MSENETSLSKKISVVVPVYFNEPSLLPLSKRLCDVEKGLLIKGIELELIFVDDGSLDGSLEKLLLIKKQRPGTKVIKHTRNFGAVHAVKTGLRFVSGDCFSILSADLQDPPELILEMVEKWVSGSKYIICVRTERSDPFLTKVFAYIYYKLVRFFVIPDFPLGGYDLAIMDRELLPHILNIGKNIYLPVYIYWLGYKPEVMYYERLKRQHGKSRWTFGKKFTAFLDAILGFSIIPIRVISLIGLLVSLPSVLYGVFIIFYTVLVKREQPGFATLVVLITFLLGMIILMLGVIGEYLWRVFDEVNNRPESVIDQVFE